MSLNGSTPLSAFAMYSKNKPKKQKNKLKSLPKVSPPAKKVKKQIKHKKISEDEEIPQLVEVKIKKVKKINKEKVEEKVKKSKSKKKNNKKDKPMLDTSSDSSYHAFSNGMEENFSTIDLPDPSTEGLKLFKWLIRPLEPSTFFEHFWEKEVFHIERNAPSYYKHILTTKKLDQILRENPLYYNRNVDVVSYENGVKEVFNQEGRAIAAALWDYYSNGCSIRVLNPQTYDDKVHLVIATLQEYFGTMVGTNVYLTPPGSQGFAPHYDDIEAFIVQLEGRKHWKLYKPKGSDVLARESSQNFSHKDIGKPFKEVTLNAGDLLYFPRGTIHEGRTDADSHSLHITISVYQHTAYADLLEAALPNAIKKAALNNIDFRKGLPLQYLKHAGYVNREKSSKEKETMKNNVIKLMKTLIDYVDIDQAADQLGKKFMHDAMSPVLSNTEVILTSKGDGDYMRDGKVYNRVEIGLDTKVRLIRYFALRLIKETETTSKLYYSTDNAKVYHGEEEQWLEIDNTLIPVIETLQKVFPDFISVESILCEDETAKIQLVADLWEKGLILTNQPLPAFSGEEEMSDSESFEEF